VLLAVAGRGGAPAGAVAAAWPEVIVKASDGRSACVLWGGLAVRHGAANASFSTWDNRSDVTFVFEGDLWLVRMDDVQIQARTGRLSDGQTEYVNVLKEIAIGGSALTGNVLHISATGVTWRKADGSEESILSDLDTEFSNELVEAKRDNSGDAVLPDREGAKLSVVHVRLPQSVELEVYQWPESGGHFIHVKIITPLESTYSGICADSTLPGVGVPISASLFLASNHSRSCAAKESEVPWPYGTGDCLASEVQLASYSAIDNSITCGFCRQNMFVKFLGDLANQVKKLKGQECFQGVIYGVAFGSKYEAMLDTTDGAMVDRLLQIHQRCFFYFVASAGDFVENAGIPLNRTSKNGLNILIPVPTSILPYQNMRRNTKLLKMHGGFGVFAFAERLYWQDAKMWVFAYEKGFEGAVNYYKMFLENLQNTGACAFFRSLANDQRWFKHHCETVSDPKFTNTADHDEVRKQCSHYLQLGTDNNRISLNSGMIDSAVIAWDMSSERCRDFNTKITCTWLGEIECFGDRDQISFPEVLRAVGVYEPSPVSPDDVQHKDRLFVGVDTASPLIHVGRSSCHWYFSSLSNSMYTCDSNPDAVVKSIA